MKGKWCCSRSRSRCPKRSKKRSWRNRARNIKGPVSWVTGGGSEFYPPLKHRSVRGGPSIYNTEVASSEMNWDKANFTSTIEGKWFWPRSHGFPKWCHFCVVDGGSSSDISLFQWRVGPFDFLIHRIQIHPGYYKSRLTDLEVLVQRPFVGLWVLAKVLQISSWYYGWCPCFSL